LCFLARNVAKCPILVRIHDSGPPLISPFLREATLYNGYFVLLHPCFQGADYVLGVFMYSRVCDVCNFAWHYQEWKDGLHNYNNHILLTNELCHFLRCSLQVKCYVTKKFNFYYYLLLYMFFICLCSSRSENCYRPMHNNYIYAINLLL
jgi:hypothetical protein